MYSLYRGIGKKAPVQARDGFVRPFVKISRLPLPEIFEGKGSLTYTGFKHMPALKIQWQAFFISFGSLFAVDSENLQEGGPLEEQPRERRIPVFPLPNVVFFPNTALPLHIFEARYRKMVSDCLAGDRYLGMILMKPGWEKGDIQYYEIGGLGLITKVVKHPGGNMDIVLRGLSRYRVREYVQRTPYLIAEVDILEEGGWEDTPELSEATEEMLRFFRQTLYKQDEEVRDQVLAQINLLENALDVTNYLGSILSVKSETRQRLLEASGPAERVELLTAIFRGELASLN